MDITSFYTLQSQIKVANDSSAKITAGNSGALSTGNFLDFIIAHLAGETQKPETITDNKLPLQSDSPVLNDETDMAELIALNPEIKEEIENWPLDANSKLTQVLGLNQKALDDAIAPATDGIITTANVEAGSPRLIQALLVDQQNAQFGNKQFLTKLKVILEKLNNLTTNPQETPKLILSNLTPEQITKIKAKIEAHLEENTAENIAIDEKDKSLNSLLLGLIQLIPPQPQATAAANLAVTAEKAASANVDSLDELGTRMNNLAPGAGKNTRDVSPGTFEAASEQGSNNNSGSKQNGTQFSDILQDFSGKNATLKGAAEMTVKVPGVKPDLSMLQNWPFPPPGTPFAPITAPYDEFAAQGSALSITSSTTSTSLVTQARSASQPHPAVQMVAASISKNAAAGESKNITLQLDPPELGRVEVRMSFGKDKSVKAVLVAEKPETLALLQRDAHALERALTSSGLDAGGSSLSFELAGQGFEFNQHGRDGGGGYAGGGGGDGAEEIIQSTMTWQVDPNTGHVRYNIMA